MQFLELTAISAARTAVISVQWSLRGDRRLHVSQDMKMGCDSWDATLQRACDRMNGWLTVRWNRKSPWAINYRIRKYLTVRPREDARSKWAPRRTSGCLSGEPSSTLAWPCRLHPCVPLLCAMCTRDTRYPDGRAASRYACLSVSPWEPSRRPVPSPLSPWMGKADNVCCNVSGRTREPYPLLRRESPGETCACVSGCTASVRRICYWDGSIGAGMLGCLCAWMLGCLDAWAYLRGRDRV